MPDVTNWLKFLKLVCKKYLILEIIGINIQDKKERMML
jgi:hypothetical protein